MARPYDRIRLGVSSLVWGADLSDQARLEVCLDEAAEIGFEGLVVFDMTVVPWLDRPAELQALLGKRGLDLAGVILRPGVDFVGTDRLTRFMAAVGADVMNISGRDGTQAEWPLSVAAIQRHAEIAARNGIRAVYQHHTGWIAETMEEYERLLADTDRRYLGVMIDCGHATKDFVGHSAQVFILRHPELDYIEVKDYATETDLRTEVGRGLTDWPAVARAIREIGYRGWIVVEQNGAFRPPKVASAESFHYVRDVLGLGSR
jgi:sugar phosphate isomerase/epimerase